MKLVCIFLWQKDTHWRVGHINPDCPAHKMVFTVPQPRRHRKIMLLHFSGKANLNSCIKFLHPLRNWQILIFKGAFQAFFWYKGLSNSSTLKSRIEIGVTDRAPCSESDQQQNDETHWKSRVKPVNFFYVCPNRAIRLYWESDVASAPLQERMTNAF